MAFKETEQTKAMRALGMTDAEIEQVLADDKAIDRGERMDFDLPIEQEKAILKMANVKTKTKKAPTVYQLDNAKGKRSRKENPTKAAIITELAAFLTENSENACENVEITNKERMIAFKIGENRYELTLIQKRKPKS